MIHSDNRDHQLLDNHIVLALLISWQFLNFLLLQALYHLYLADDFRVNLQVIRGYLLEYNLVYLFIA